MNPSFMPVLTGALLSSLVGYLAAWYMGQVDGNFPLVLLVSTAVSGIYWLAERFYFLPQRLRSVEAVDAQMAQRQAQLQSQGIAKTDIGLSGVERQNMLQQPWWLDWTAGLFPVIATVFLVRSFVFEPFRIPSGSMVPTLYVGDLILVNKFHYGLRLPVVNHKITEGEKPQRGDVMVFRYPPQPSLDYIKRVVGLPGDKIAYINKQLFINGQQVAKKQDAPFRDDNLRMRPQFVERIGEKDVHILNYDERSAAIEALAVNDFPFRDQCQYTVVGVACTVPEGHYFMMGDSRDNSQDSRYWGFVPEANIVGKAQAIWMNFSSPSRIGRID